MLQILPPSAFQGFPAKVATTPGGRKTSFLDYCLPPTLATAAFTPSNGRGTDRTAYTAFKASRSRICAFTRYGIRPPVGMAMRLLSR